MGSTQKNNRMSNYTPSIQYTSQRTKDVFRVNIIIASKSDEMLEHLNYKFYYYSYNIKIRISKISWKSQIENSPRNIYKTSI